MGKMVKEFRDFINKGNMLELAVAVVLGAAFGKVIDQIVKGIINPIIAAIFGKPDFTQIGFDIGDARISIGLVLDALIQFLAVAFVLFLIVKAYNSSQRKRAAEAPPAGPSEVELLTEIRDQLRNR